MTKKHFIKIATMLKKQRWNIHHLSNDEEYGFGIVYTTVDQIEQELINIFVEENPRFNLSRFKKASQPTEKEISNQEIANSQEIILNLNNQ